MPLCPFPPFTTTPQNGRLYASTTLASLTALLFGYSVGIIGGILVLPSFSSHFGLSHLSPSALASARTRIVILWLIGAAVGAVFPVFLKSLGRRGGLRIAGGLYVIGAGVMLVAGEGIAGRRVLEVGRFVNGLGVGVGTLVGPMFISEVSPASTRGMLMSGYQTLLQLGGLIGFWFAFATDSLLPSSSMLQWQLPVAVQIFFGALLILGSLCIPETPRWYLERKEWEEAKSALAWFRSRGVESEEVREEFEGMCVAVEAVEGRKEAKGGFLREVRKGGVWRRLYVGTVLMALQNLVGLNAINYYIRAYFPKSKGSVKTRELNVSTYAMVILLLFSDIGSSSISCEEIQARTNIPMHDLTRNLQSLAVAPKTRVLIKEPMSRDVKPTDKFSFNEAFYSPFNKLKIGVVSGTNKVEDLHERRETEKKNNDARVGVIEAAIVRIMKSRKELSHQRLVTEVIQQLSSRFSPDVSMLKKRIESLIEREYLERVEGEEPSRYRYLA